MTPSLSGRLQTRVLVLAVVGGLWTLAVTPVLPGGGDLGPRYRATFAVLLVVVVLGLAWELLYHGLQQFRWEKDWPLLLALVVGVPEGVAAYAVVRSGLVPGTGDVGGAAFLVHFATTWLVVWLFLSGPVRVPFVRWRFRGGRFV